MNVNGATSGLPLGDEAYHHLRNAITRGAFAPRAVLREADLTRTLKMSRTPIREALRRLQAEGLLRAMPQGGFLVVELTDDDMVNVYRVRAVLEGLAIRLAAEHRTNGDMGDLADTLEAMDGAVQSGDDERLAALNSRFHEQIASASRNAYLQTMLAQIRDVFERYRRPALTNPHRRRAAHHEHHTMMQAIRDRDADAAANLVQRHVEHALSLRLSAIPVAPEASPDGSAEEALPLPE